MQKVRLFQLQQKGLYFITERDSVMLIIIAFRYYFFCIFILMLTLACSDIISDAVPLQQEENKPIDFFGNDDVNFDQLSDILIYQKSNELS